MNLELGSLQSFDCKSEPSRLGTRWIKWKRLFVYYLEAKGIEKDKKKKALLLHCAGSDVQDISWRARYGVSKGSENTGCIFQAASEHAVRATRFPAGKTRNGNPRRAVLLET